MTLPPVRGVLYALALLAWALLFAGDVATLGPGWCGGRGGAWNLVMLPQLLDAALRVTPLSDLLAGSALMLVAMMVPLVLPALDQIRVGGGSATLFLTGYCLLWLPAIMLLSLCSSIVRLATLGQPWSGIAAAATLVLLWHASPLRTRCLAACRRSPGRGSFRTGARQALGCIGACSAAMAVPPLFGRAHLAAMAVVALLLWIERRLPRWRTAARPHSKMAPPS